MRWYGLLRHKYHFKFFKGYLPQTLLDPFLNTLTHLKHISMPYDISVSTLLLMNPFLSIFISTVNFSFFFFFKSYLLLILYRSYTLRDFCNQYYYTNIPINSFLVSVPILYPLKTLENIWFSDVFRECKLGTSTRSVLNLSFISWHWTKIEVFH